MQVRSSQECSLQGQSYRQINKITPNWDKLCERQKEADEGGQSDHTLGGTAEMIKACLEGR